MSKLSIITALHNCVDFTRAYVDSLRSLTDFPDWELILVDDASSDDTPCFLESLRSDTRILSFRQEHNRGFAHSNNKGVSLASGDLLAFLNNDLTLTPHWLTPMLETLDRAPEPGIVGNIQINPNTGLIDHAGVFFGLDGMPRQARKNRARIPDTHWTEWNAVTAACMLMRKGTFLDNGGFDTAFRNGFEDIDLCVRLRRLGLRHYVANRSHIFHHVSQSPGRHHHNHANERLFHERWSAFTRSWGEREWPSEYLKRYARHWWKLNFRKTLHAAFLILADRRGKLIHRP